jgi:hypothetical protein
MPEKEVLNAIKLGEFSKSIIDQPKVAVIMTQHWCPQWLSMKSYIDDIEDVEIFVIVYDQEDYTKKFMELKENKFGNDLIPYVRFYKKGKLIGESNYISKEEFIGFFN